MHPRARSAYVAALTETRQRAAKAQTCPACGAEILHGDDHDRVSYPTAVDAEPLAGLTDDMLAHFDGRSTYDLVRGDLYYRQTWHTGDAHPIYAEHRCRKAAL